MRLRKGDAHVAGASDRRRATDRLLLETGLHGGAAVALLALTAITLTVAETAFPAVMGRAIDSVVGRHAPRSWLVWVALLVALLATVDALDELALGVATARSTAWLRSMLSHHVLSLGTRVRERFEAGDLVARVVGNTAEVGGVAPSAIRAVANLIPAIGGPVGLALIDPWLCVTFLAGVPVLFVLLRALRRQVEDVSEGYLAAQGRIAAGLVEALGGVRTIAAAGTWEREADRVLAPLPELSRHGLGFWRTQMRISAQNGLLVSLLEVAVLSVAGAELAAGHITPGQMLAAGQYVLLGATMTSVLSSVTSLGRARAAASRIAEVLGEAPVPQGTAALSPGGGRLEFRGVTVRSDGKPLLREINLVVPPGALVAIVGHSGAGKSLLGALAGRLLDPDAGEVLLDGTPLRELQPSDLRAAVSYGFERPSLIGETVEDAIALGPFRPPLYRVVEAAVAARADDFIRRLPRRYHTALAAAPMSAGEAQRVGLARTFAHAGRVLILDDVAASLDTVTEHQISQVLLAGALADRTRMIVAHRASTAAAAESVVWLEQGAVRRIAPHAALWSEPEYRALFGSHAEAYGNVRNGAGAIT
jgi:ATP-binding cassette subfamily B protein